MHACLNIHAPNTCPSHTILNLVIQIKFRKMYKTKYRTYFCYRRTNESTQTSILYRNFNFSELQKLLTEGTL